MEPRGLDWRTLLLLLIAGLALLLALGCAGPGAGGGPVGYMEVRLEAGYGESGAESFRDPSGGGLLWFGAPTWYPLSFVGRSAGADGSPVVTFEIAASHRQQFRAMTRDNEGARMGMFADGELLAAPSIAGEMGGSGVLAGTGWDLQRCTEVRRALLGQQPPTGADG